MTPQSASPHRLTRCLVPAPRSSRPGALPLSARAARRALTALGAAALLASGGAPAQAQQEDDDSLPTIEEHTEGMRAIDGLLPLYYEASEDRLWMEIPILDTEILHSQGLAAGLGSNDIGLDRGALQGSEIVLFERHGPRVLMVQPNYRFRASSDNPAEVRAVRDAFARSVLFSFEVEAETGDRVLVDLTDFLLRDGANLGDRMGGYSLEEDRSSVYLPMTQGFPENTELEVELTFVEGGGGPGGPGGRGRFFEGVGSVAATGDAASLRFHHSFILLPDDGYEPRAYDPRAGYGQVSWEDYAVPLDESLTQRFIRRHRLEKVDPSAEVSDPVEPIVYYLDPGVPEPVRSALMEGAGWWNQAFEAAGYRDAFQVELLPEDVSPLDVRYNVINWVHRSTRGWSYGSSITDPRTGEIIKGAVTLGSLRIRQDYMIAEGLLSPYEEGTETPPELAEWALARIRQLSAHEVGHTIGLGHNYYDSELGRISVMDYPHPLVTLEDDGSFDHSEVYEVGIAEWDTVAVAYGYQDFPEGVDEEEALQEILDDAWERDIRYLTNQDLATHPWVDQWVNGEDPAEELGRLMDIRRVALDRFGETAIKRGMPMATLEEVLVPLYMNHRYAIEAASSSLGGVNYIYSIRGDGRTPFTYASGPQQSEALDALLRTLEPSELVLPRSVVGSIPPRPSGYGENRELFPSYTGDMFDLVTPAVVVADLTLSNLLQGSRAARLIQQHALDPDVPSLAQLLDRTWDAAFDAAPADAYEAEVNRAVEAVLVQRTIDLARSASMPQVRAVTQHRLERRAEELRGMVAGADEADAAHYSMMAGTIERFLEDPGEAPPLPDAPDAPPGAPIGEPALDYLGGWSLERTSWADAWSGVFGPLCVWEEDGGGW